METKATIKYETTECGRCGGSGRYSYCQRFGSVCFKCGGSKRVLTRSAATAKAKIEAWKAANRSTKPAGAIVAGDRIFYDHAMRTVVSVSDPSDTWSSVNGVRREYWQVVITIEAKPMRIGYCTDEASPMGLPFSAEQREVFLIAYARTLAKRSKGITVVKPTTTA